MQENINISPIFIVGCPRSGTTPLRDLLRSHPNLTFPDESQFIPEFFRAYGDPVNEYEARQLAARILKLRWIRFWDLSLEPASFADLRSFRQIVSRIYEEWARKENKPRWGDKTPQYVTETATLLEIFPSCKIIHIYRDGRDVALSWLRTNFGPSNIFTAASAWKRFVSTGCSTGITLPPETYLEVRYETLLSHPRDTMKRICAFIGEPFCDAVLQLNPLKKEYKEKLIFGTSKRGISDTELVDANVAKWKKEMSLPDQELFESVAGDLLESLGYETIGKVRRVSKSEQFKWSVHHSFWWFLRRLNELPTPYILITFLYMNWARILYRLRSVKQLATLKNYRIPRKII